MTRKFTVTEEGIAALLDTIELTSEVIELSEDTYGYVWTMQATYGGISPVDTEGWIPWPNTMGIGVALEKGYIKELS